GPDEEREPRHQQQEEEHAAAHQRADAGRRDDRPGASLGHPFPAVAPVSLIVDRHVQLSPTALANTSSTLGPPSPKSRTSPPPPRPTATGARGPPLPGTNPRITSSSTAVASHAAAASAAKKRSGSVVLTLTSNSWPRGDFKASIGPATAIAPLAMTTTWSHV